LTPEEARLSLRVLILAPTARDAQITCRLLEAAGLVCIACAHMLNLLEELEGGGAGAVLLTEEVLQDGAVERFLEVLSRQPSWSDLPVVMLMRGGTDSPVATRVLQSLRNVTLLERPAPMRSVQSAVQAAVRGRARQYQMRATIEEIRRTERRSSDLQQQLEMALEASGLGTFHCEIPLDKIVWNERCKAHFWLPPDAPVDFDLFYTILHPDDRERTRLAVEACVYEGKPYEIEYRTLSPEGLVRWVRATGRTYRDDAGRPIRFDGTTQDITERKHIEDEREMLLESERAARTEAERANRVKDEFLATVSHELRTPLNAILGWTQLLGRSHHDAAAVAEAVAVIDRNARLQAELIEDLLDMSRIISGKLRLNMQPVDLEAVITAAIASVQPAASAKQIRIQKEFPGPSPGPPTTGDPARLQQVIWNLLTNAVKFTPQGATVTVTLRRSEGLAEIRVADTGSGLDPAFIPHMFERFRQADSSTTRKHGGLGLGLAIVKHLVERHSGSVEAENVPGPGGRPAGAAFTIRLPVTASLEETPRPGGEQAAWCESVDLTGLKVMVVDDDADARRLLKRLLGECKAVVTTASSGREALQLLPSVHPDVLVSDIGMPEMDGYEFIARVRRVAGEQLPAAAVTAFGRSEDKRRALAAGYQTHIAKPIEPSQLLAVVARLGGRRPTGGPRA
jgi:signal transduction histidine kinase/CheY-like chemotaxis protein